MILLIKKYRDLFSMKIKRSIILWFLKNEKNDAW